jgi:hypothetical protein
MLYGGTTRLLIALEQNRQTPSKFLVLPPAQVHTNGCERQRG